MSSTVQQEKAKQGCDKFAALLPRDMFQLVPIQKQPLSMSPLDCERLE